MGSFDDLIPGGSSQGGSGAFDDLIPKKSSLARRVLGDTGVSLLKGAVAVPEAAVGLGNIVSGGLAGKYAEQAGFRPKEAKAALDEMYSPEQKAANQYVQEGDGFLDTIKRGIERPSVIGQSVAESLPLLLPGAAAARGIGAATKVAPYIAGAAGEGLVGAGSAAEQLRQGSEDGTISGKQTLGALASGVGTFGFGAAGGKLASSAIGKKLGISDIDTVLAGGASNPANIGLAKRALSGAVSEGVLEELPQSMWEQAAQNYATDKPLGEGVGQAGAMGLLAGTAMGGTFNAMQRGEQRKAVDDTNPAAEEAPAAALGLTYQLNPESQEKTSPNGMIQPANPEPKPKLPENGPMAAAINVGVDSGATSLRPQGSFSDMSEFANLLGQEQQDVQSRRTGIAGRQALQREVALQDADQRVADQMAKEAAQRRRAVLDQVLSDPTTQNPADRFAAELQRQGFRDSTPTADELATVQRFNDIKAAEPAGPEIEPSLPNEVDAEQLGIRSRKGSSGAQSSGRDKVAEVRQLVADGWKISNKTLVSPTGKKRILNTAEHAAAKEATRERNLAAMERYRQSKGKGTPVSTTNVVSEETNAPEIEQMAAQTVQANDAQIESQSSSAPQAEGVAQAEPAEAAPVVDQSEVDDYGKRVVRRNKPVSKWTAEEIQDRLARADSGESPISNESRSQLQAALEPLVAAKKEKEAKAAEQAERVKKMQAAKAANKDTFQIGENKDSLERVSVRDGVVHLGDYPATDYNSGDDITVPDGATKQQVLDALIAGEAVTKKAKVWGKNGPEQSVADRIAELQAERDAMSKAAQKYADQVQSAIAAGEQEGISKAEVMADIGAKNEEVGQIQRSSQEGANGNDGSPGAATEGGREERDGDAQGQESEVADDGRVSSEAKQSKQDNVLENKASYTPSKEAVKNEYGKDLLGNVVSEPEESRPDSIGRDAAAENRDILAASIVQGAKFATVAGPRKTGEVKSAIDRVFGAHDAAHVLAGMRKNTQENFNVLVLDENRKPISVLRLFAGSTSQASVFPEIVAKAVYETPGAARIWYAHNHPSGTAVASSADERLTKELSKAFGTGTGVTAEGHVIIAGTKAVELDGEGYPIGGKFDIPAGARTKSIQVTERTFHKTGSLGAQISSPDAARKEVARISEGKTGVVFLNAQNIPVAFLPMQSADMSILRNGRSAKELFGAAARSNASAAILNFSTDVDKQAAIAATRNIYDALSGGSRGISVLDSFLNGESFSEKGYVTGNDNYIPGTFFSRDDVNASRGQGSGMAFRDLQAVVDRVSKGFNNLPKIHVLDSPRDLSDRRDNERTLKEQIEQAGAMDDVEGAHHNGEIYLFASGIASEERAEHVLATHEITHYGLRGTMGKGLDSALQNIWLYNKEVRAKAAVLRMQLGLTSNVSAVEEVLAEMKDSDLVKLKGWRKMVQAFRDWVHKAGFDRIAEKLDGLITNGMSDQEKADLFVANMVNAARDWVRNGKPARGYDPGTSMLGDANFSAKNKSASVDASITEIFDGLAGRGLKKQRAEERLAEHSQAESIRYVQDNILDILEELEGAGTIKINC